MYIGNSTEDLLHIGEILRCKFSRMLQFKLFANNILETFYCIRLTVRSCLVDGKYQLVYRVTYMYITVTTMYVCTLTSTVIRMYVSIGLL